MGNVAAVLLAEAVRLLLASLAPAISNNSTSDSASVGVEAGAPWYEGLLARMTTAH